MRIIKILRPSILTACFILQILSGAASAQQNVKLILQTGHADSVNAVAYSPDGKILATASDDNSIVLWDAASAAEIGRLENQGSAVHAIAFSPDGKTLAAGDAAATVKFWNIETGQMLKSNTSEDGDIISLAYSPNGKIVASSVGGTIRLLNADDGGLLKTLDNHGLTINAVAFSPDGGTLVSSDTDAAIHLWNVADGTLLKTLKGHTEGVYAVRFSPDGRTIVSGGGDKTIKIWNAADGRLLKTLRGHAGIVSAIAFSPDGKIFASGGDDKTIILWNARTGVKINALAGHSEVIFSLAFSPDGGTIASGSFDHLVKLWDAQSGVLKQTLAGKIAPVNVFALSPDGKLIASGSGAAVKLWNLETGILVNSLDGHGDEIEAVAFSPDGRTIAGGSRDNSIKIWNADNGNLIKTLDGHTNWVKSTAFSPDGKTLISSSMNEIILWNAETGAILKSIKDPENSFIGQTTVSPDGKIIVSRNTYGLLKFWSVETGALTTTLKGEVNSSVAAFSPDGKMLTDGRTIWNAAAGTVAQTLKNIDSGADSAVFSIDGKTLVIGDGDGAATIRSVETGEIIKSFAAHISWVNSLAFTPDGGFLISCSRDGTTKIWDAKSWRTLISLVVIGQNDWLTVTPDGFFDGTPAAWKQLLWRFNGNLFDYAPVETYFNDFFYPNLLQSVFRHQLPQPKAGRELAQIDRRQPRVSINAIDGQNISQTGGQTPTGGRTISVSIEVTDNADAKKQPAANASSGARDVRLFRSGSLVKIWRGDAFAPDSGCSAPAVLPKPNEPRRVVCEARVTIIAGENNLTAYAFNAENVKSNDSAVMVKGADSLKRDGTLYILAVGVNKYANPAYDLNFAVTDVEQLGAQIKIEQQKITASTAPAFAVSATAAASSALTPNVNPRYAKIEIITLTDTEATKANFLLALKKFSDGEKTNLPKDASDNLKAEFGKIKTIEPEDALIVDYSGHGTSQDERFYLLPHDFTGANERNLQTQAVSDEELGAALEQIDAGKLLMIVDACQSGQALGAENAGRGPMNSKGLAQLAYDKGMLILTAAQSQQAALEAVRVGGREVRHGLLTYALLEGLTNKQADADANGKLSEREWFDYAVEQVPQLQIEAMKQRSVEIQTTGRGSQLAFVAGDEATADPTKRQVQTPRVFYRRESAEQPLMISRP